MLLITCGILSGQQDTIIFEEIDYSLEDSIKYLPKRDLLEHPYWRNYLRRYDITSIKKDSRIEEAYRLIYRGQYFSIIEVIKKGNLYCVKVDSSKNKLDFRTYDTISNNSDLQYIYQYCQGNIYKKIKMNESDEDMGNYIGDWAFEFKINGIYNSLAGAPMDPELRLIYMKLMKIGGLSQYRIFSKDVGFQYYK